VKAALADEGLTSKHRALEVQIDQKLAELEALKGRAVLPEADFLRKLANPEQTKRLKQLEDMYGVADDLNTEAKAQWHSRLNRLRGVVFWEIADSRPVVLQQMRQAIADVEALSASMLAQTNRLQSAEAGFREGWVADFSGFESRAGDLAARVENALEVREEQLAQELKRGMQRESEQVQRLLLNRVLLVLLALSLVSGCGLFRGSNWSGQGTKLSKEIAQLPELDLEPIAIENGTVKDLLATEEEVLAAYRAVYGKVGDPDQNRELGKRLADLELARAEMLIAEGDSAKPFSSAVELYEGLLSASVDTDDRDTLLYQLAQANDMAGDSDATLGYLNELIADFPDSPYVLEARFRRAEMRFSSGNFGGAVDDYAEVTAAGDATKYWLHASYMLGWSPFKRTDLEEAAEQFYQVVEITTDGAPDSVTAETDASARVSKELLDDALRVLMLTLNYDEGAATLAADMRERDRPAWQYLVYERMVSDHIDNDRYLDGVATWQVFVDENPLDKKAPGATVRMINILDEGDFPSEIQPKKEEFVARYGVRSEYWQAHNAASREGYLATLRTYLDELSQLRHAQAQKSRASKDYLAAADYYEQTIETFPKDPKTGDTLFLLAEVYTDASMSEPALVAYQKLMKQYPEHPKAADAGYASILALDRTANRRPLVDGA